MTAPRFSIIIPTYDRPDALANCLGAVARLAYARDQFEVIIVDDGGPHPAAQVAARFAEELAPVCLLQSRGGPAKARNYGAARARGKYLVFTDDDCAPFADWLSVVEARFASEPDAMLGGPTINGLAGNPYSVASQLLTDYLYDCFYAPGMPPHPSAFLTSNNLAVSAERFGQIGGFNEQFPAVTAEDREISYRWQRAGFSLRYAPEMRAYHYKQLNWRGFWRQHFVYGAGAWHYHRTRAAYEGRNMRIEPAAFYLNLLRYPFRAGRSGQWRLTGLLALTQVANAAGFLWESAFSHAVPRAA